MITIRKIYKKDIPDLFSDVHLWNHSFLSISRHRLISHSKNPNLGPDDIVLILSYIDDELVGYMGIFIDRINIDGISQKIGWLSTWWVHPKTKGSGNGRLILDTMYAENEGKIGISQFTPSAKRVYDKSGYFTSLKQNSGLKAVLRINLSFVLPALFPRLGSFHRILNFFDHGLNFVVNIKLQLQKSVIRNELKDVTLEYINYIDAETFEIINKFNHGDISFKGKDFFDWLKAYPWVLSAPLVKHTEKHKYEFSMYDKEFGFTFIKIFQNQICKAFIVLQKRSYVTKVLFTYYDTGDVALISNVIKLQEMSLNTREIICYDEAICTNFKKSSVFLYTKKKLKHSIISKVYNKTDFDQNRMQLGDGDCAFA